MNEDSIRREVQKLVADLGFVYLHIPRNTYVEAGKPDIWGIGRGSSLAIEVKTMEPRIKMPDSMRADSIRDAQRAWLDWLAFDRTIPTFLAVGTLSRPRRLWVVTWQAWVLMEDTLWVRAGKDNHFRITASDLDERQKKFEMIWYEGTWKLPVQHLLADLDHREPGKSIRDMEISLRLEDRGQEQGAPVPDSP